MFFHLSLHIFNFDLEPFLRFGSIAEFSPSSHFCSILCSIFSFLSALLRRQLVILPHHSQRFFSHDFFLLPGRLFSSILPCITSWKIQYFSFLITWAMYFNFQVLTVCRIFVFFPFCLILSCFLLYRFYMFRILLDTHILKSQLAT